MRKTIFHISLLFLTAYFLVSCHKEYRFSLDVSAKIKVNQKFQFGVTEKNGYKPDAVEYTLDGKVVAPGSDISSYPLGKHVLQANIKYGDQSQTLNKSVIFLAAKPYEIYDYEIVNTYPHDTGAYTQGLEYLDGYLYESTGRQGQSSLRKTEIKTGKVLQKIEVPDQYFAEGMTIVGDTIYQLTWQNGKGFLYKLKSFEKIGEFPYQNSREGWGLTHDDKVLYKSDGTEKIWKLDPKTQKETGYISCYTNKQAVKELNELEYIHGKIYANVWMKNVIIIIDPATGAVEGVADMNGLVKKMSHIQHLKHDDVLNGIAYDLENDRLFVTGKYWSELFEIKLHKRK